jgi:hypothetical protein
MTIVEKAAYLKGLTEGLGVEPDSRDGKLWGALNDLLADMAHEIEDLQSSHLDLADAMDEMCEDLTMLEEMVDAYDVPDDSWDDEDEFFDEDEDPDKICDLDFSKDEELDDVDEDEEEDEELEVDGVLYDATCPSCGEEITFDEETLEKGSIRCPNCGEELEFDLGEDE